MKIERFTDQLIQHEDYFSTAFNDSDLWFNMSESRDEAIEASQAALSDPNSGWSRDKLNRMDDEDVISADREGFFEMYNSLLANRIHFSLQSYKYESDIEAESDNVKIAFILHTFITGRI